MQQEKPKTISRDTYLKALALCMAANDHYVQAYKFEICLLRLPGIEDDGCLFDAVYNRNGMTVSEFDDALANDGFVVEPDPPETT